MEFLSEQRVNGWKFKLWKGEFTDEGVRFSVMKILCT
jgi:hypothetical protein